MSEAKFVFAVPAALRPCIVKRNVMQYVFYCPEGCDYDEWRKEWYETYKHYFFLLGGSKKKHYNFFISSDQTTEGYIFFLKK